MTTNTDEAVLWKIVNEFVGDCRGELSLDEQLLVCRELRRLLERERAEPIGYVTAWLDSVAEVRVMNNSKLKIGDKLYAVPSQDALDAKRYRWLRHNIVSGVKTYNHGYFTFDGDEELDAAIDAAMQEEKP